MDKEKGILIYEKPKAPLIRLLGVASVFQVAAWATFSALAYKNSGRPSDTTKSITPDSADSSSDQKKNTLDERTASSRYQVWWPLGGLLVSLLFTQLLTFYARRNVKSIRLLGKCAERARIVTHSLFRSGREGRPDRLTLEVPTARLEASASARSATKGEVATFGIRGYSSYFQIDRKRGFVHDKTLLDALIEEGGSGVIRLAAQHGKERIPSRPPR
jgi:hypothetical protein